MLGIQALGIQAMGIRAVYPLICGFEYVHMDQNGNLFQKMFTNVHIGRIQGQNLGYYGNDGVCLSQYFVTTQNPQKIFSVFIVGVNFVCFIAITLSYI